MVNSLEHWFASKVFLIGRGINIFASLSTASNDRIVILVDAKNSLRKSFKPFALFGSECPFISRPQNIAIRKVKPHILSSQSCQVHIVRVDSLLQYICCLTCSNNKTFKWFECWKDILKKHWPWVLNKTIWIRQSYIQSFLTSSINQLTDVSFDVFDLRRPTLIVIIYVDVWLILALDDRNARKWNRRPDIERIDKVENHFTSLHLFCIFLWIHDDDFNIIFFCF